MMPPVIPGIDLQGEVGRGAFGIVYHGRQPEFAREVAVKVLMVSGLDERQGERFRRELAAMGKLSWHPNIVTVYSAGLTKEREPYIVMEYLSGGSLGARLKASGPMPSQQVLEIGVRLASALETAHRAHILHRDVKPENVLLSRLGEPKLTDFGIAQVEGLHSTRTGVTHMSIAHAPPELINAGTSNPSVDVYALASTLATLLLGRSPYVQSDSDQIGTVIGRIVAGPVPDLLALGVAPAIAAPLTAALSKAPEDRPASALAFAERLNAAQRDMGFNPSTILVEPDALKDAAPPPPPEGLGVAAIAAGVPPPPPDGPTATVMMASSPDAAPPASMAATRTGSRRRLLIGTAAAIAALLVAGGVVFAVTRPPKPCIDCGGPNVSLTPGPSVAPSITAQPTLTPDVTGSPTASVPPSVPTYLESLGTPSGDNNTNDPPTGRGNTTINGKTYADSIWYQGGYSAGPYDSYDTTYDLYGQFSTFTATLGITNHVGDSCDPTEQATFQVKVDGVTLNTYNLPTGVSKNISLPISNGQSLELITLVGDASNSGESTTCDAVWGNAEVNP